MLCITSRILLLAEAIFERRSDEEESRSRCMLLDKKGAARSWYRMNLPRSVVTVLEAFMTYSDMPLTYQLDLQILPSFKHESDNNQSSISIARMPSNYQGLVLCTCHVSLHLQDSELAMEHVRLLLRRLLGVTIDDDTNQPPWNNFESIHMVCMDHARVYSRLPKSTLR